MDNDTVGQNTVYAALLDVREAFRRRDLTPPHTLEMDPETVARLLREGTAEPLDSDDVANSRCRAAGFRIVPSYTRPDGGTDGG